jgi:hypothetical protein
MSADPGPTASPLKGAKRLVAEHVEQIVVVRHHLVFGMHVDPFSNACNEDRGANRCVGPGRGDDQAAGASS